MDNRGDKIANRLVANLSCRSPEGIVYSHRPYSSHTHRLIVVAFPAP